MIKKAASVLFNFTGHILALSAIFYAWLPVAKWYFNYQPILGVDFFNTVTYATYFAKNFVLRINGWKYIWYGGVPLETDYPTLHASLIAIASKFLNSFSMVQVVQLYMLFSTFLFLVGSYFLLYVIGKNKVLSAILTVAISWSFAVYGALVWGGSLPYYATQAFFPFVLLFLVLGLKSNQKRFVYISAAVAGLSTFGHQQIILTYISLAAFFIMLLFPTSPFSVKNKIKTIIGYFLIAGIVASPNFYFQLGPEPWTLVINLINQSFIMLFSLLKSILTHFGLVSEKITTQNTAQASRDAINAFNVAQFNRSQLRLFFERTNDFIFWALGASAVLIIFSFLIGKNRKKTFFGVLPYFISAAVITVYISLLAFGIDFLHGAWYRVFWTFPLMLSLIVVFSWKDFTQSLAERFGVVFQKKPIKLISVTIVSILLIFISVPPLIKFEGKFFSSAQKVHGELEWSSAYPRVINGIKTEQKIQTLKNMLHPSWMDPNNKNFRFYDTDAQTNIWWNAYFDMPLVRGYIDPPLGSDRLGGFFWVNTSLDNNQATEIFKLPEDIAKNNSLFLLDWYSIKYLSALHTSDNHIPLSTYVDTDEIIKHKEILGPFSHKTDLYEFKTSENDPKSLIQPTNKSLIWVDTGAFSEYEHLFNQDKSLNENLFLINSGSNASKIVKDANINRFKIIVIKDGYHPLNDYLASNQAVGNMTGSLSQSYLGIPAVPEVLSAYLRNGGKIIIITNNANTNFNNFQYQLNQDSSTLIETDKTPVVVRQKYEKGEIIAVSLSPTKQKSNTNEALIGLLKFLAGQSQKEGKFSAYSDFGKIISIEGENAEFVALSKALGDDKWIARDENGNSLPVYKVGTQEDGYQALALLPQTSQSDFKMEFELTGEQPFTFYEVKDELVSPIIHPVNAPVIGVIASDGGYETFLRTLGGTNLNSQKVIPVKLPQKIDDVNSQTLNDIDALILYGYDYKNYQNSWNKVADFVKGGKSVFIETGMDVKQSNSQKGTGGVPTVLPDVFPVEKTNYDGLGKEWKSEKADDAMFETVDIQNFSPPILNGEAWRFSYSDSLRNGSKSLLSQNGKIILAEKSYGKGSVVWSGLNLPYLYVNGYNMDKAVLMENIIKKLVTLGNDQRINIQGVDFSSPQKVSIKGQNARGVLFKEQGYPSWKAFVSVNGSARQNVPIFTSGPTFPGFMYVSLPEAAKQGDFEVEFVYGNSFWAWFYLILSLIAILSIIDYSLFGNRTINRFLLLIKSKFKLRVGKWWEKEDEY